VDWFRRLSKALSFLRILPYDGWFDSQVWTAGL